MNNLPASSHLPIGYLSACLNNVTNSYKFYWFLSIIDFLRSHQKRLIPIKKILAGMISHVWYPINYFNLSFGKQDQLAFITSAIKEKHNLNINLNKEEVYNTVLKYLSDSSDTELANHINGLARFVPFRFLTPWFSSELRGKKDHLKNKLIEELAEKSFSNQHYPCLYKFVTEAEVCIEIQQDWYDYFQQHYSILIAFCLWHLLNYLQKHNPHVPNIAAKLFEPEQRDLKQAKIFWDLVFDKVKVIQCIYSNQPMYKNDFSLDHFLPWRFVAHDLQWNLIPAPKSVNSSKSDCLPDIGIYFNDFSKLQYNAFQIIAALDKPKLLEDYTVLFKKDSISEIKSLDIISFCKVLNNVISPQIQIAKNMGFSANWKYIL